MKNIILLLSLVLILNSGYGKKMTHTYTDTIFNDIKFAEIIFTLDKKTNDTLYIEGILKQREDFEGVPCYGSVSFNKNWDLKHFTLADDYTFTNHSFPKDTYVELSVGIGRLEHYFAIRNSRNYIVHTCRFADKQQIDGLVCKGDEDIIFRTDWNLLACILGEEDTIAGNLFEENTFVRFDDDGSICCYCLYEPVIQSYHCKGDDYTALMWMGSTGIKLYSGGQLKYFQPITNIEIQGVLCKPSAVRGGVHLYENGSLKKCLSAKDQTINGQFYKKKLSLEFDRTGNVTKSYKDKFFR